MSNGGGIYVFPSNLRTFGGRIGTHDVLLDGAALTDEVYGSGTISRPPSLDSIEEFHVEVNATSAKFSRPTSVILAVSKVHPIIGGLRTKCRGI